MKLDGDKSDLDPFLGKILVLLYLANFDRFCSIVQVQALSYVSIEIFEFTETLYFPSFMDLNRSGKMAENF